MESEHKAGVISVLIIVLGLVAITASIVVNNVFAIEAYKACVTAGHKPAECREGR